MFDLFIQIRDGQPYQHPIFGDNLREAFPSIDTDNLPKEFARFIRHEPNLQVGPYEVLVENYVWNGDVVEDNWSVRPMTEEEALEVRTTAIESIERDRSILLVAAESELDSFNTEDKIIWQKYIDDLRAYTYTDPLDAKLPIAPRRNTDGTLVSIDAPGTAPNVTG